LAGQVGDELEVMVVMKHDGVVALRDGREEDVRHRPPAVLTLRCEGFHR
jgi:hypothetical protein